MASFTNEPTEFYQQENKTERKLAMSRTTGGRQRLLDVRAALAALAIAATAAAPVVAFAEATHPAKSTVSAEPNNDEPTIPDPSGGSAGYSPYSPPQYYDDFDYASLGGGGGGGG
jgi:hypothetical protein